MRGLTLWAFHSDLSSIHPPIMQRPNTLPQWQDNGVTLTLIAGNAYGHTSPVKAFSPILYLVYYCQVVPS